MSNNNANIAVTMDISDFVAKNYRLLQLNQEQIEQLKEVQATRARLNKDGKVASLITEELIDSNYKLVTSYTGLMSGNKRVSQHIKATSEALKQQREEARLLAKQAAEAKYQQQVTEVQSKAKKFFDPLNKQLVSIDPNLDLDRNGKLTILTRRIAEIAAKSKLSVAQVSQLYERLNSNQLQAADGKFTRLISTMVQLNREVEKAKRNANATAGQEIFTGLPPVKPPTGKGKLPPDDDDIERAKKYSTIYDKIRNSLDYFLLYKGFNLITGQLGESFENARKFQVQVSLIRTISQDAQLSFKEVERGLIGVSNATGQDFLDTANAAYDAISNQVTRGRQTFDFVKQAGDLARTTNSSLQDSTNLLSSAINSYGFDVEQAEQISANFFKTIDLGRIKANELANTFGRVAFVGRDLGVDFEELLAVLSTLTRKGVTTDDAITLLTNGMTKLTNPTDKMKSLLNEWGFSSGKAAVSTLGFTNTMFRLVEAIESGRIELTDLFNEIRGEKYAAAFKQYKGEIVKDLDEIKNKSLETFQNAKVIRGESDADVINKQINQLKNSLAINFGDKLTNLVKQIIDVSGGVDTLVAGLNKLTNVVLVAGSAFVAYKAATLGIQTAMAIYNGVLAIGIGLKTAYTRTTQVANVTTTAGTAIVGANTVATSANTAATRLNAAAYAAHPIGLFVAAGAALYAYWKTSNFEIGIANEKIQQFNQEYEELKRKNQEIKQDQTWKAYTDDLNKATASFKGLGERIANELADANRQLDLSKTRSNDTAEALKAGFGKYTNFMKDRISEVSREYNRLDDRIHNSAKGIENINEETERAIYNNRLKYSGGVEYDGGLQRAALLKQELARISQKIEIEYSNGTDESLQKARQLYKEWLATREQLESLTVESDKYNVKQNSKTYPEYYQPDQNGNVFIDYNPNRYEGDLRRMQAHVGSLEKQYQARLKEQHKVDEQTLLDKKQSLAGAENAIKQLDNFKIINNSGEVAPEFKDKVTGRADFTKIKSALEKRIRDVKKNLDPEVLKKVSPELDRLLKERLDAIQTEVASVERVERLRKEQTALLEHTKKTQQAFQEGKADVKKYGAEIDVLADKLDRLGEKLKSVYNPDLAGTLAENRLGESTSNKVSRAVLRVRERFQNLLNAGSQQAGLENRIPTLTQQATDKLNAYRDAAEKARQAATALKGRGTDKNGVPNVTPEEASRVVGLLQQQIDKAKEFSKELAGGDVNKQAGIEANLGIPELDAMLKDAKKDLADATKNYSTAATNLAILRQDTNAVSADLDKALQTLNQLGPATTESIGGAAKGFESFNKGALQEAEDRLSRILTQITNLKYASPGSVKMPEVPPSIPSTLTPKDEFIPPKMLGGEMSYYAHGGPVGSDMQQVYAQAGEYIWNRTATRRFYPQIQSMNAQGRTPVEFYTSQGDTIHANINVNESRTPQLTGAEIERALRRQQRRG